MCLCRITTLFTTFESIRSILQLDHLVDWNGARNYQMKLYLRSSPALSHRIKQNRLRPGAPFSIRPSLRSYQRAYFLYIQYISMRIDKYSPHIVATASAALRAIFLVLAALSFQRVEIRRVCLFRYHMQIENVEISLCRTKCNYSS